MNVQGSRSWNVADGSRCSAGTQGGAVAPPAPAYYDSDEIEYEVQERAAILAEAAGEGGGRPGDRFEAMARVEVGRAMGRWEAVAWRS